MVSKLLQSRIFSQISSFCYRIFYNFCGPIFRRFFHVFVFIHGAGAKRMLKMHVRLVNFETFRQFFRFQSFLVGLIIFFENYISEFYNYFSIDRFFFFFEKLSSLLKQWNTLIYRFLFSRVRAIFFSLQLSNHNPDSYEMLIS